MQTIEVCRAVKQSGCHLVRPRKDAPGQYDAKPYADGGNKRGWFYLDSFSASAILTVYEALNEANKAKMESLPIPTAAKVAFKLLK